MRRILVIAAAALGVVACGSRADPLAPLRPLPPALLEVEVFQQGTDAILRFEPLPQIVNIDGAEVNLDRIELLVLTDRYPAIAPEILATALEAERRDRLEAAREAAERAERTLARQRGEEIDEEVEAAEEEEEPARTAEELLLRRVPSDARMAWRSQGVRPEVLLESARRLETAVDQLWLELGLPSAIVDLRRPPELPDPVLIIEAADRVSRSLAYESTRTVDEFLLTAAVVAEIPFENLDDYRTGDTIQLVHPVGTPADAPIRTRHFFAVRAVSEGEQEGRIGKVLSLAPTAVPLPPANMAAAITEEGVQLTWEAPASVVTGAELAPDEVGYNVYRRRAETEATVGEPLNDLPLRELEFLDEETVWDVEWIYEVRALLLFEEERDPTATERPIVLSDATTTTDAPLKESFAAATEPIFVGDVFPPTPPSALEGVRAGRTVTVRWRAATGVDDLAGYRVYRHAAPRPELPGYVPPVTTTPGAAVPAAPPTEATAEGATEETGATGAETGQGEGEAGQAEGEAAVAEGETEAVGAETLTGEDAQVGSAEDAEQEDGTPRRIRRNLLVAAGWELLTAVPVTDLRYIDPSSDPAVTWFYVVEAVDEAGNVSPPLLVEVVGTASGSRRP